MAVQPDQDTILDDSPGGSGAPIGSKPGVNTTVSVSIVDANGRANNGGTVSFVDSSRSGPIGRTVKLLATPNPGFVFSGWQYESSQVLLDRAVDVVGGSNRSTLEEVCRIVGNQDTRLYRAGDILYEDENGNTLVPPRTYWSAGNGFYYYYNNNASTLTKQICPVPTSGRTGGGGSGGGTIIRNESGPREE